MPSPTGRERDAALVYARPLAASGAEVEVDETIHDSPNVIGRLEGRRPGPTMQLAGHIDHMTCRTSLRQGPLTRSPAADPRT